MYIYLYTEKKEGKEINIERKKERESFLAKMGKEIVKEKKKEEDEK